MRYATVKYNDVANAPGVAISVYLQGCPHHCFNCFNQETWDFNGGKELTEEKIDEIISRLNDFGVQRSLCILGGEPMCLQNLAATKMLVEKTRRKYPDKQIYVWTGYLYEQLKDANLSTINYILDNINVLVDGPFVDKLKDLSLELRGSSNQRVIYLKK